KRWLVLRSASNKGPCRLEKYVDEKAARNVDQHKVQLLTNVAAITRILHSTKKHAFTVDFHDGSSKSFACDSGRFHSTTLVCKCCSYLIQFLINYRTRSGQLGKVGNSRMLLAFVWHLQRRARCAQAWHPKGTAGTVPSCYHAMRQIANITRRVSASSDTRKYLPVGHQQLETQAVRLASHCLAEIWCAIRPEVPT